MRGALLAALVAASPVGASIGVAAVSITARPGEVAFFSAPAPPETDRIVSVLAGPNSPATIIASRHRVAGLWLGVRRLRLIDAPTVMLFNVSCPACNGLARCEHRVDLERLNGLLTANGVAVGRAALALKVNVQPLFGSLGPGETDAILDAFWTLKAAHGLYGVRENAIRLNAEAIAYQSFSLPRSAPPGNYTLTTIHIGRGRVLALSTTDVRVACNEPPGPVIPPLEPVAEGVAAVVLMLLLGALGGLLAGRGDRDRGA